MTNQPVGTRRPLWEALLWEKDGSLNLSSVFLILLGAAGTFVFVWETITGQRASISGWSFVAGAFVSVLIGSVPIAKAKILAKAKLPSAVTAEMAKIPFEPHEWANGKEDGVA